MSGSTKQGIKSIWATLRAGGASDDGVSIPTFPTDIDCGSGPVRLGLGEERNPRLLIPIEQNEKIPSSSGGEGILVRKVQLTLGSGKKSPFLDIMCTDAKLEQVFDSVVENILNRLRDGNSASDAVEHAVDEFRLLLRQTRGISLEERIGLIGELLTLSGLVGINSEAIELWTGPDRNRHDFSGASVAFEVKTSLRSIEPKVTISSIDQLEEPKGGQLYLVHHVLEKIPLGAISFSAVIDDILNKGANQVKFSEKLEELETSAEVLREDSLRFRLLGTTYYRVSKGFPRIVSSSFSGGQIPDGVSGIKYQLNLAQAQGFKVDMEEVPSVNHALLEE